MANYHVELSGALSLQEQAKAIEGEEALGTKFVSARIWVNAKNAVTNLAEFAELDAEPNPALGTPTLTNTLPTGASPEWAGPLIVQGSAVAQVYLLRASAS